jgi:hypothetical protein
MSSSRPNLVTGYARVALVALIVLLLFALSRQGQVDPVDAAPPAAIDKQSAAAKQDSALQVATDAKPKTDPKHTTETLRGRIVWLGEALKERYGIEGDADAAQSQIALATTDDRLVPLVKDNRGRGFWIDPRLRDFDLELTVRRFEGSPVVQVVRVYTIREGRAYELDYWCDTCSIPMYELKDCECCQGPTRFRERLVDKTGP